MSIHRVSLRTPQDTTEAFCVECGWRVLRGFWLYWPEVSPQAVWLCDKCLAKAKANGIHEGKNAEYK